MRPLGCLLIDLGAFGEPFGTSCQGSWEPRGASLGSLGGSLGSCASPWEPRGASFYASWRLAGSCVSLVGSSLSESADFDYPPTFFDGFLDPRRLPEGSFSVDQRAFSSSGASKRLDERVFSSIFERGGFEEARAVIEASGTQPASAANWIQSESRTIDRAFEGVDLLYLLTPRPSPTYS